MTRGSRQLVMIVVPIVIVMSFTVGAAVGYAHFERLLQAERQNGIARNPYDAPAGFSALNRADDGTDQAVVLPGLLAIRFHLYCVSFAIHSHRFDVDNQIIVAGDSHHKFHARTSGNCQAAIVSPYVLIHGSAVNLIVSAVRIDGVVVAHGNHCSGIKPRDSISVTIPVMILSVLGRNAWKNAQSH
jgi:NADH:ubiquinone oxidoreductase subunit 3 (subunit A)